MVFPWFSPPLKVFKSPTACCGQESTDDGRLCAANSHGSGEPKGRDAAMPISMGGVKIP